MITSIRIDDNKKTPFKYIQKIKAFKNGSEFIFKPGVNVIVGKNGSGKSTLLNMISKYMLCMKIQVELNLEDVFEEAMYNEATLKEEFTSSVRLAIIHELKEKFKNELKIEDIARESMNDLVENASEKKYRFRLDYMDDELTVDEFIRGRMKKVVDSNIETMVESKAKSFVNELRKRYDMAFAAFVVDSMRKQNMLKDEKIAELLKDNPDER